MKKILVRAPDDLESVILSFPFMHALREEFKEDSIQVIASEEVWELYRFLPFELSLYSFPLKKNTLTGIHHYAYNLHDVFNIDVYFDLIDDFKSVFMGFAFRAKERMGSDEGLKRYLLTKKFPPKFYASCDQRAMGLLKIYTGKDYSHFRVHGMDISLLKGSINPYLLILIDDFKTDETKRKLLRLFLDSFERQKFIFWNFDNEDYQEAEVRQNFFSSLVTNNPANNDYEFLKSSNYKHLTQLLLASKGVFCDQSWKAQLGAYFGMDTFYWGEKVLNPSSYFKFSPSNMIMKSEKISVLTAQEARQFENIDTLVDYLHEHLVL